MCYHTYMMIEKETEVKQKIDTEALIREYLKRGGTITRVKARGRPASSYSFKRGSK